jgi:hypothetical protein
MNRARAASGGSGTSVASSSVMDAAALQAESSAIHSQLEAVRTRTVAEDKSLASQLAGLQSFVATKGAAK